eukprot:1161808-Pelagomonas_calceolata.AAC.6
MTCLFWMPPMFWELSPPLLASSHDVASAGGTSMLGQLIRQTKQDTARLGSWARQAASYFT